MKPGRIVATSIAVTAMLLATACGGNIYSAPPVNVKPGPALWAVADEDTTIYLFGTVHALPDDADWFDSRIAGAFDSADELVTEIDISLGTASAKALAEAGALQGDKPLRELMTPADRMKYDETLVTLGLPVEALDRMEPWLAAMTLSALPLQRAGYSPQSGVEVKLGGRAANKTLKALESLEEQIAVFDQMPMETQLSYLKETIDAVPRASKSLDAMVGEWIVGDAAHLAEMMNAELADPVLYDRLLVKRNASWAVWIRQRMEQPGTVFVAVGAGHLAGKGSVQEMLQKRGIKVRRIWQ